jgi:hypothetical protein
MQRSAVPIPPAFGGLCAHHHPVTRDETPRHLNLYLTPLKPAVCAASHAADPLAALQLTSAAYHWCACMRHELDVEIKIRSPEQTQAWTLGACDMQPPRSALHCRGPSIPPIPLAPGCTSACRTFRSLFQLSSGLVAVCCAQPLATRLWACRRTARRMAGQPNPWLSPLHFSDSLFLLSFSFFSSRALLSPHTGWRHSWLPSPGSCAQGGGSRAGALVLSFLLGRCAFSRGLEA